MEEFFEIVENVVVKLQTQHGFIL